MKIHIKVERTFVKNLKTFFKLILSNVDDLSLLLYAGEIPRRLLSTYRLPRVLKNFVVSIDDFTYSVEHLIMSDIYCYTTMHDERERQIM